MLARFRCPEDRTAFLELLGRDRPELAACVLALHSRPDVVTVTDATGRRTAPPLRAELEAVPGLVVFEDVTFDHRRGG